MNTSASIRITPIYLKTTKPNMSNQVSQTTPEPCYGHFLKTSTQDLGFDKRGPKAYDRLFA